jgi:amino acid transporter
MKLEDLTQFDYKRPRKLIKYLLLVTAYTNVIVGLSFLFINQFPGLIYLYLITGFTTTFILLPIIIIFGCFIFFKKTKSGLWKLIKNEVVLVGWTLGSLIFYFMCLLIATKILKWKWQKWNYGSGEDYWIINIGKNVQLGVEEFKYSNYRNNFTIAQNVLQHRV